MSDGQPYRSVLYVPASNARALAKTQHLCCDAVIVDLEDAVAPAQKAAARDNLGQWATNGSRRTPTIVRTNALSSEWSNDDLALVRSLQVDIVLVPKVREARDIADAAEALSSRGGHPVKLWAMIETPQAILDIASIAAFAQGPAGVLTGLVVGTNDLAKETDVSLDVNRRYLLPWLMQVVLAARVGGLLALDGVTNDFSDLRSFRRACVESAAMGFDGKTLIHPKQIEDANAAFLPSQTAVAEARAIVAAFSQAQNAHRGAISLDGRMVERLHLVQAERLLARTPDDKGL